MGATTVGVDETDEEGHGGKLRLDGRFDEHLAHRLHCVVKFAESINSKKNNRAFTVILSLSFRNFATFTMAYSLDSARQKLNMAKILRCERPIPRKIPASSAS
jgi:hypothetical protein